VRLLIILLGLAALALLQAAPAPAGTVPYFHDFMGGVCVKESDLEAAYRAADYKGWRAPPTCMENPCAHEFDRIGYGRQILGRDPTDGEWSDYQQMWDLVCSREGAPESMTMLLPAEDLGSILVPTAYYDGTDMSVSDPVVLPMTDWVIHHVVATPTTGYVPLFGIENADTGNSWSSGGSAGGSSSGSTASGTTAPSSGGSGDGGSGGTPTTPQQGGLPPDPGKGGATAAPVPAPLSLICLGSALAGLALWRRRKG